MASEHPQFMMVFPHFPLKLPVAWELLPVASLRIQAPQWFCWWCKWPVCTAPRWHRRAARRCALGHRLGNPRTSWSWDDVDLFLGVFCWGKGKVFGLQFDGWEFQWICKTWNSRSHLAWQSRGPFDWGVQVIKDSEEKLMSHFEPFDVISQSCQNRINMCENYMALKYLSHSSKTSLRLITRPLWQRVHQHVP